MRTPLPGTGRVLAAQAATLPQPDQLCGPYAAHLALHAVLAEPPPLAALALAAGTRVWPHDVPAWRPTGAALDRRCWDVVPEAASPDESGTDAGPLVAGLPEVCDVAVLAVAGAVATAASCARLLDVLADGGVPVGVVAHVRTGPLAPPGTQRPWDVGHFVVLVSWDAATGEVGVADSYPETGAPGWPPACRGVDVAALASGLAAGPGRGLLLLVRPGDRDALHRAVGAAGLAVAVGTACW